MACERFAWFESLLAVSAAFDQDWRYYGRKCGWNLKVHDGAKTLLELTS